MRTNCQVKAIYRNRKRRKEGQGILPLQGTKGNSIENFSFCIEYPLCVLAHKIKLLFHIEDMIYTSKLKNADIIKLFKITKVLNFLT